MTGSTQGSTRDRSASCRAAPIWSDGASASRARPSLDSSSRVAAYAGATKDVRWARRAAVHPALQLRDGEAVRRRRLAYLNLQARPRAKRSIQPSLLSRATATPAASWSVSASTSTPCVLVVDVTSQRAHQLAQLEGFPIERALPPARAGRARRASRMWRPPRKIRSRQRAARVLTVRMSDSSVPGALAAFKSGVGACAHAG